jgi:glycosyltransferase involved in cell wall biosynthesis
MKVSIITVCYNSTNFISSAIESVLRQTYPEVEYIVIDGGSLDGTVDILNKYKERIDHLVSEPDLGIYDAMNKGVKLASGDVIGILNSDDFYLNDDVIANVVNAFKHNVKAHFILGNVDYVTPDLLSSPVRFYSSNHFSSWKMRFGFMPAHPGSFIKKAVYEDLGLFKLGYKIGADFDFFVRAFVVNNYSYVKLDCTLVRMRLGGVSTAGFKGYMTTTGEILKSLKENGVYSNLLFVLMRLPCKFINMLAIRVFSR